MAAESIGKRVRERRLQEGLSQEELARQVGISRNYLSQIEQGQATNLSWQVMQRLTTFLGLKAEERDESPIPWDSLPEGLADFAREATLPLDDIRMLAGLEYRGQKPSSPQQWKTLYNVIKAVLES